MKKRSLSRRLRVDATPPAEEDSSASEAEVEDDSTHDQLLSSIASLGRKRRKAEPQRSEPSSAVSEYHLPTRLQSEGGRVSVGGLLRGLEGQGSLKKRLVSTEEKAHPTDPPLAKLHADKIHREVAYRDTAKRVSKWDPIVKKNKLAEHLSFPLQEEHVPPPSLTTKVESFKPINELEREIAAVLAASENVETNDEDLTAAEKKALIMMSLEEAEQRRNELQKMRALMSYHEQKCRRTKKIKSKKFHRIKRRAEARRREREEEEGGGAGEADLLERAERLRATERVTLKHTSKAKWARKQLARGHKDPSAQLALSEHHHRGQQLKQKMPDHPDQDSTASESAPSGSDSEGEGFTLRSSANPWFENEKSGPVDNVLLLNATATEERSNTVGSEGNTNTVPVAGSRKKNIQVTFTNADKSTKRDLVNTNNTHTEGTINLGEEEPQTTGRTSAKHIDPSLYLVASGGAGAGGGLRGASEQLLAVQEAFAGDDVVENFSREKEEEVKKSQPKDIDLTLPGWGVWGGEGVRPPKKRVKVVVPAAPAKPRRDARLQHVIINEQKDKKLAKHLVSSLPWPYTSKEQFEKAHCAPLGRLWNTEATFQQLVKPRIRTTTGALIEPLKLTEDVQDFMKRTKSKKTRTRKTTAR